MPEDEAQPQPPASADVSPEPDQPLPPPQAQPVLQPLRPSPWAAPSQTPGPEAQAPQPPYQPPAPPYAPAPPYQAPYAPPAPYGAQYQSQPYGQPPQQPYGPPQQQPYVPYPTPGPPPNAPQPYWAPQPVYAPAPPPYGQSFQSFPQQQPYYGPPQQPGPYYAPMPGAPYGYAPPAPPPPDLNRGANAGFGLWVVIVLVALLGGAFGILSAFIEELRATALIATFFAAPIIEEGVKPSGVYLALVRWPGALRSRWTVAALAALGGLTFGLIESTVYVKLYYPDQSDAYVRFRYTVPVFMHALSSCIWGLGIDRRLIEWAAGRDVLAKRSRLCYVTAVAIHGLYNLTVVILASAGLLTFH